MPPRVLACFHGCPVFLIVAQRVSPVFKARAQKAGSTVTVRPSKIHLVLWW